MRVRPLFQCHQRTQLTGPKYVQIHPPPVNGIVTKNHILHRCIRERPAQLTPKICPNTMTTGRHRQYLHLSTDIFYHSILKA